jgi:hypothetical protein
MRVRTIALIALALLVLPGAAPGVRAYLKFGIEVNNRVIALRFKTLPIRYFVTDRDAAGVTASQFQAATQRGFDAWAAVRGVSLSSQFVGFTGIEPFVDDGINVFGFRARPELDRTLGATTFEVDDVTGELIEADIFLNSSFDWSVASAGDVGRFDVQSIMTHELGHLHGLGHSALGETEVRPTGGRRVLGKQAIMFPIAFPAGNIDDRRPKADDIAGLGEVYPASGSSRMFGQMNGHVTLNGRGLFGAHLTAFNPATGELVSGFSLDRQGTFSIGGLTPGLYVVRAEPLDDGDLNSFFDNETEVEINFKPTYFSKIVAVPAGGAAGTVVDIKVTAK